MITFALDFESRFDTKNGLSANTQGYRSYYSDSRFEAYMVSIVGDDGYEFVGHPRDLDWSILKGARVVAFNAYFDRSLYEFGVEAGWWPRVEIAEWRDCMDMCSYIGIRRSLKNAVRDSFGVELSKDTRDNMDGKIWEEMTPEFQEEVLAYALEDSRWALKLWQLHSPNWPEWERELSEQNYQMAQRGIPVDEDLLDKYIADLTEMRFEMESDVPWTADAKLKSRKAFDAECRKHGLKPPKSLAKTDLAAQKWFAENEDKHGWIAAFRDVGRVNTLLLKLKTVKRQTRDGRFYPSINYAAAVTRRWTSGGGGVNIQNLSREAMFGVNIRHIFKAPEGYRFITADLSQIEIRTTLWLAGDTEMLDEIRNTPDVYEALAVGFQLWRRGDPGFKQAKDKEGRSLRQGVKTVGLGIQFGASANKVAAVGKIPLEEATFWRDEFLAKFPKVPKLWKKFTAGFKKARQDKSRMYTVRLPSGNTMNYRNIRFEGGGLVTDVLKGKNWLSVRPWFGLATENCLAGETEVITQTRGWVPLVDVRVDDKVWDGQEWVDHRGVKAMGLKATVDFGGVRITPDHRILTSRGWVAARDTTHEDAVTYFHQISRLSRDSEYSQSGRRAARWSDDHGVSARAFSVLRRTLGVPMRLRRSRYPLVGAIQGGARTESGSLLFDEMSDSRMAGKTRSEIPSSLQGVAADESSLHSSTEQRMEKLRGPRHQSRPAMVRGLRQFLGRYGRFVSAWSNIRPRQQRRGLLQSELRLENSARTGAKYSASATCSPGGRDEICEYNRDGREVGASVPRRSVSSCDVASGVLGLSADSQTESDQEVFDILNAGPRNRFTVRGTDGRPFVVHNCAQSMARDVMGDAILRIEKAGWPIVMHIHDEIVAMVPENDAERALEEISQIMRTPPSWVPDLPLDCDAAIVDRYTK